MPVNTKSASERNMPDGYATVIEGKILAGDLVWNDSAVQWEPAEGAAIGDDSTAYHHVARLQPRSRLRM